jgi:hypothetical protein
MCSVAQSQLIGDVWVTSIIRAGGGPALLVVDRASRYHFTCSYIVEGATGW